MGLLSGIGKQLSVAGRALRVLLSAPQVFIYPILAVVFGLGMPIVFVGGGFLVDPTLGKLGVVAYVVGFPLLFAFLMVAYCYEVNELFEGRSPGFASGLRRAAGRIKMVVLGGLVIGVGGMATHYVGDSIPFGDALGVGSRWGLKIAGVFAFPAIATSDGALKETFAKVKAGVEDQWGKSIVATVGTRAVGMVIFWTGMLAAIALAVLAFLGEFAIELPPLGAFTLPVILPVAAIVTAITVQFTVDGVVKTALFRYAMDGELPPALGGDADALLSDSPGATGRSHGSHAVDD
ncbi:hypothetical protein [Halosimplex sp. J119]